MKTKTLAAAAAYALWIKENPLTYEVTGKFEDDHIITSNLSKQTSIEAAIDRYKRNQNITTSSWIMLDKDKLVAKAQGAQKRASVHQSAQQLTMAIKVNRRTVTISLLDKKERQRYEHQEVQIGTETHYLNCGSDEKEIILLIVGPWNPVTGEVGLYHYQEGALPGGHVMLPQYLKWNYDDTDKLIGPVAKK